MNQIRVLVVEDEFLIQDLLEHELKGAGFEIVTASNVNDALQRLNGEVATFRALVTDINLKSEQSGWDVARNARRLNADMPVIYMTGDSGADWPIYGVPNSILVTKPFAPVQIITALGQLLNVGNTPGV
jgi:DNA-binding response OmpR family regulator